jgi:hypothetical protein
MKTWMAALMCLAAAPAAAGEKSFAAELAGVAAQVRLAQASQRSATLSDKTTEVDVPLNEETVKCSARDYSAPFLKVLIPALADITALNHRNAGEGAPCIAAGQCRSFTEPQALLSRGGERVERVAVRVTLKKETALDGEVCRVTLVETVNAVIRGTPFFHERRHELAERVPSDCR